MTSRAFRIVGNLKMHLPRGILQEYGEAVDQRSLSLMVPHPYLSEAKKLCENTGITIGAQDVSAYQEGAHTGEVSANMLQDLGVTEVLVGHSETRHRGEDVTLQLDSCRQSGLSVIYCIGEDSVSYENGETFEYLSTQLEAVKSLEGVSIAYEPRWSIGTGKTPSFKEIENVVVWIRAWLETHFPGNLDKTSVLYGGSINQNNCFEIYQNTSLDGFLVGGVSLKPAVMMEVIDLCKLYS